NINIQKPINVLIPSILGLFKQLATAAAYNHYSTYEVITVTMLKLALVLGCLLSLALAQP
ncbi:Cobyrinate ac-diamide synthase, partial [Dissostichus eleginoides]